jgi:hypothetical protein
MGGVPLIPAYSRIFPRNGTLIIKKEKLKMQNSLRSQSGGAPRSFGALTGAFPGSLKSGGFSSAVQEAGAGATRRVGDRRSTRRDRSALVRFGPAGTAWDRLGPDKFFSPREKMSPKPQVHGLKPSFGEMRLSAESRYGWVGSVGRTESWHVTPSGLRLGLRLRTDKSAQVVDISSRMAKSCAATDWFSAPCGENRRFSTHLSPLSRLIYRLLRRKRGKIKNRARKQQDGRCVAQELLNNGGLACKKSK